MYMCARLYVGFVYIIYVCMYVSVCIMYVDRRGLGYSGGT